MPRELIAQAAKTGLLGIHWTTTEGTWLLVILAIAALLTLLSALSRS